MPQTRSVCSDASRSNGQLARRRGEYCDIALRDLGLLAGALALARLATTFHGAEAAPQA